MDNIRKILIISSDEHLKDVLSFCFDGWGYDVCSQKLSEQKQELDDFEQIKKKSPDVIIIDVQSARSSQLSICSRLKNDFTTAFIPVITLINKRHLRNQLLRIKQGVDDYLIKPPDPLDLRMRIEMALRRAQHSINANTLTGLPGAKILEDIIQDKFRVNKDFSFCYLDIDNFKSFNDFYGYQKGDKVLIQASYLLQMTINKLGNKDDFVSHIGGDDFAFVTTPDKCIDICNYYIKMFDGLIPFHYRKEDRESGFIVVSDRSHKVREVPLMSVSIAVVNKEGPSLKNIFHLNERVSELKRFLKKTSKSSFMVDRRDSRIPNNKSMQINKQKRPDPYRPIGQIFLDQGIVSSGQLDEALEIHWKKGIVVGEVLRELGFVTELELRKALSFQKVNLSDYLEPDLQHLA